MSRPAVVDPSPWQFPLPHETRLDNGLRLWRIHLPGQRLVAAELVLPAPVAMEDRCLEGIAAVALHAADEATRSHPDVIEQLEVQGAALGGSTGWHHTHLSLSVPARRLPNALRLFAEVVTEPAYDDDAVAHHAEALEAAWRQRMAAPGGRAPQQLRAALFGPECREGRELTGTAETLAAIRPDDVVAWHARHWHPAGATLVVAGDLEDLDDASLLSPFERWRPGAPDEVPEEPGARDRRRCVVVDHPGAAQTVIRAAQFTPGRRDVSWPALKLGGHAMAGAFSSRLNLELRERRGFTYGVSGGVAPRRLGGWFTVAAAVANESAAECVALIHQHLALPEDLTTVEVADCARFLVQAAPLNYETAADIAHQSAVLAAAKEHPRFVNEVNARYATLSAEEVSTTWRRLIAPERLTAVLVGPAEQLSRDLERVGIAHEVMPTTPS